MISALTGTYSKGYMVGTYDLKVYKRWQEYNWKQDKVDSHLNGALHTSDPHWAERKSSIPTP